MLLLLRDCVCPEIKQRNWKPGNRSTGFFFLLVLALGIVAHGCHLGGHDNEPVLMLLDDPPEKNSRPR